MPQNDVMAWVGDRIRKSGLDGRGRFEARRQLKEYFSGRRRSFEVPMKITGTPFERRVYRALCGVLFGHTITYGALARRVGSPRAARAVGSAMRRNPLPILVPCHRVVPANGGIGRYAGGRQRKAWLFHHERPAHASSSSSRSSFHGSSAGSSS